MLNIEKYKDEIKEYGFSKVYLREKNVTIDGEKGVNLNIRNVVDWLCSEYKEPLLDDEEKEFLQDLMEWYKFNALKINDVKMYVYDKLYDDISYYRGTISIPLSLENEGFYMFQNLEDDRMYTLEELGI